MQAGAHQGHMLPSNRWTSLQVAKGAFGPDDMVNLIAELMFRKPIPVKVCAECTPVCHCTMTCY